MTWEEELNDADFRNRGIVKLIYKDRLAIWIGKRESG
jgi:hypothetical protein